MEDMQFLEKVSPESSEVRFSVDTVEEAETWARGFIERGYTSDRIHVRLGEDKIRHLIDKCSEQGQRVAILEVKDEDWSNILGFFYKDNKEPLHPMVYPVIMSRCARCGGSCEYVDGPGPAILSVADTPPDASEAVRKNLDRARRWILKNLGEECSDKIRRKAGGNFIQFESDASYIARIGLNHPQKLY